LNPSMYRELTLRDFLQAFLRRKNIFLGSVGACVLLGVLVCIVMPKKYEASGTVELETPSGDGLDRSSLMGSAPAGSDALSSDVALQTQAKILQSDAIALRTIAALHLETQLAPAQKPSGTPNAPEAEALAAFRRSLTVKPIPDTKLVQISFANRDPKIAAAVVNELAAQLTLFSEERMSDATTEAAKVLSKQLEGLRSQSEGLQKQVASMQSQTGLYQEGTGDGRPDGQAYSAILSQFQRASSTLSDATQNKILKDSIYNVAKSGNPELISSLAGNSMGGASGLSNSLGNIESLRANQSQMQSQLDTLKVKFGPDYPKVAELEAGIASTEKSIESETQRIKQRAQTDASIADQTLRSAQANYDQLKGQADALNSKTVDYRITVQEADESRSLYTDLMKRLKEAGVIQGLHSTNVTLVDKAIVPRLPSRPIVPLYMAVAFVMGIVFGVFAVAAVELLDDRIYEYESVEEMGLRISGLVPRLLGGDGITVKDGVLAIYHNAIRTVRNNVTYKQEEGLGTVVAVMPATPHETSRQFALSLTGNASQSGQRVLFVEANLSKQELKMLKSGPEKKQLGNSAVPAIESGRNFPAICHLSKERAIGTVPLTQDSKKLRMRFAEWRTQYDVIVIDASAQMFDADAASICDNADVVLQVATYGVTTKSSLRRSSALLRQRSGKDVSVVIQGVPVRSAAFTNYYGCAPALTNV
jgi:succinoglycan biosynthesis transport protein ExoP